jgi:hypothetical protein
VLGIGSIRGTTSEESAPASSRAIAGDLAISTASPDPSQQSLRVWTEETADIAASERLSIDAHRETADRAA